VNGCQDNPFREKTQNAVATEGDPHACVVFIAERAAAGGRVETDQPDAEAKLDLRVERVNGCQDNASLHESQDAPATEGDTRVL
jgi:uracil-DNA glycosylase